MSGTPHIFNGKGISESFRKRANEAAFWEAWVGAVLARAGLFTLHHPFPADGSDQHGQTWDLDVSRSTYGWTKVEVKSLNLTFHNPDDYPFPGLLVCSKNSWERKWHGATESMRDFLFVSRATGAILWLPIGAPVKKVTITDRERGETYASMQTESKLLKPVGDFQEYIRG